MMRTLQDLQAKTLRLDFTGLNHVAVVLRRRDKLNYFVTIPSEGGRLVGFEEIKVPELRKLPLARHLSQFKIGTGPVKDILRFYWDIRRSS